MNTRLVIPLLLGTVGIGTTLLLKDTHHELFAYPFQESSLRHATASQIPYNLGSPILPQAILATQRHQSIKAEIRQTVNLFGHRLAGHGIYLERRWPEKEQYDLDRAEFRLELNMQTHADEEPSSLLAVCDRRYFWQYRNLQGSESLLRIDVPTVAQKIEETGKDFHSRNLADWFGLGGLAGMLRGIRSAWDFGPPEETLLDGQEPVYLIRGEWNRKHAARILPDQKEAILKGEAIDWSELPEPLPDRMNIYLSQDDLFPHRFEYIRDKAIDPESENPNPVVVIVIDLFEVDLNGPIPDARFLYSPGDLQPVDQTRQFLTRHGLE